MLAQQRTLLAPKGSSDSRSQYSSVYFSRLATKGKGKALINLPL
mgnify:CR=1 FL=1